ncbi:MAG: ABC transporter ATP-binding protein [Eubacterium sp.]|nr:ABC transporter ATP-binding protein [Eubacterium sp.]
MFKIIGRIGRQWWMILIIVLVVVANVVCDFLLPIQLGKIIKVLQEAREIQDPVTTVIVEGVYMLLIAGVSAVTAVISSKLSSMVTARAISVTRYQLFKRIGTFSFPEMDKFSTSTLVTRTTNDLTFVGNTLNIFFRFVLYGPLIAAAAIIGMVFLGKWQMTLAIAIALGLIMAFILIVLKIVLPRYDAIQGRLDKVALVTRENLDGLRVIRAYTAEKYQEDKFAGISEKLMKDEVFSNRGLNLLTPIVQLIFGALNVAIYFIGANLIAGNDPTFQYADIAVVVQFSALILTGFILLVAVMLQMPRTIVCANRVNEVIDTEPAVKGAESTPEIREEGTIEFKNVTFTFPGAERPVVENVSFKVGKGETIAFIGATGSGKSTIINLLLRFMDVTKGEILVDGVNVKDYRTEDLNARFGYVPQKGYLFHDTLQNNITIGRPDASPVVVDKALDISQSKEFVSKLPGGVDYEISQGGKNVSGGQRQRLCIARALVMEPEIFVFDDSFSALDYRTDKILRGEIKKRCAGVTNVIVAQRVGTILDAGQIVCLDEGRVMGIGTHRQLLDTCPIYREIALSQMTAEELGIQEG